MIKFIKSWTEYIFAMTLVITIVMLAITLTKNLMNENQFKYTWIAVILFSGLNAIFDLRKKK